MTTYIIQILKDTWENVKSDDDSPIEFLAVSAARNSIELAWGESWRVMDSHGNIVETS